jgi:hypothetical protein
MVSYDPIISAKESAGGISIIWLSGNENVSGMFSYERIIDMKVNAGDLLNYPERYGVVNGREIIRTDFCNPEHCPGD